MPMGNMWDSVDGRVDPDGEILEQQPAHFKWAAVCFPGSLYNHWTVAGPHSPCRSAAPPSYTAETTTFPIGESTPPSRARSKDPSWMEKNRPSRAKQTAACGQLGTQELLDRAIKKATEAMGPMTVPSGRKRVTDPEWGLGV